LDRFGFGQFRCKSRRRLNQSGPHAALMAPRDLLSGREKISQPRF
jgi:hypothetical protein